MSIHVYIQFFLHPHLVVVVVAAVTADDDVATT